MNVDTRVGSKYYWLSTFLGRDKLLRGVESLLFTVDRFGDLAGKGGNDTNACFGHPGSTPLVSSPGAPAPSSKGLSIFAVNEDGHLFERPSADKPIEGEPKNGPNNKAAWIDHGRPDNKQIVHPPGALINNSSLFVVVEDGRLFELKWLCNQTPGTWVDHGRPSPGVMIISAPSEAIYNSEFFVVGDNGRVYRHQNTGSQADPAWTWKDLNLPLSDDKMRAINIPQVVGPDSVFVVTDTGRLVDLERAGTGWTWANDYGQPFYQPVISATATSDSVYATTDYPDSHLTQLRPLPTPADELDQVEALRHTTVAKKLWVDYGYIPFKWNPASNDNYVNVVTSAGIMTAPSSQGHMALVFGKDGEAFAPLWDDSSKKWYWENLGYFCSDNGYFF